MFFIFYFHKRGEIGAEFSRVKEANVSICGYLS